MRPFTQTLFSFAIAGLAAVLSGGAAAQPSPPPGNTPEETLEGAAADALIADAAGAAEQPEELTVRGRQDAVGRYRMEMVKAREGLVETFNELNNAEENEITCKNEAATGTRMTQNVCRSKAENDASARAAKGFLDGLLRSARGRGAGYDHAGQRPDRNGQRATRGSGRRG